MLQIQVCVHVTDTQVKTKFWGKSMEVQPVGLVNLRIPKYVNLKIPKKYNMKITK